MTPAQYKDAAEVFHKKSSLGLKILGSLLMVLGLAAVAIGVAVKLTGLGVVPGAAISGGGILATLGGIGFFAKGEQQGAMYSTMNQLASEVEQQKSPSIQ